MTNRQSNILIRFIILGVLLSQTDLLSSCRSRPSQTYVRQTPIVTRTPANQVKVEDLSIIENDIHEEVNRYRRNKGLTPLQPHPLLKAEADRHSQNMAAHKVAFGHAGYDDRKYRILTKLQTATAIAENAAFGKLSASVVVSKWLQSPGHKKNIEGRYNLTGIGVKRGKDGYLYFTQIFIYQKNI